MKRTLSASAFSILCAGLLTGFASMEPPQGYVEQSVTVPGLASGMYNEVGDHEIAQYRWEPAGYLRISTRTRDEDYLFRFYPITNQDYLLIFTTDAPTTEGIVTGYFKARIEDGVLSVTDYDVKDAAVMEVLASRQGLSAKDGLLSSTSEGGLSINQLVELFKTLQPDANIEEDVGRSNNLCKFSDQPPASISPADIDNIAIEKLVHEAQQCNPVAGYALAQRYQAGRGISKDPGLAYRWYAMAAELGYAPAQVALGKMYLHGAEGVEKNGDKAATWLRLAAEQGVAEAQSDLGVMYGTGQGVEADNAEAVKWLRMAAEQNSPMALFNLGVMYENGTGVEKDLAQALEWYQRAAAQGNPNAAQRLAVLDQSAAEKTAESMTAGEVLASSDEYIRLLNLYSNAVDAYTSGDHARAYALASEAAAGHIPRAYYLLGMLSFNGEGTAKNLDVAREWYLKAAESGEVDAYLKLADLYAGYGGHPRDDTEMVRWARAFADTGDMDGQFYYGRMFLLGDGVAKDGGMAAEWFTRAAEQGHRQAMFFLAKMYKLGKGVPVDLERAAYWEKHYQDTAS